MKWKLIYRLAYDGEYQKAIEFLCDIVEKQGQQITELVELLNTLKNTV